MLNPKKINSHRGSEGKLSPRAGGHNSARGSPRNLANSPRAVSPRNAAATPKSSINSQASSNKGGRRQISILDAFKDEILDSCQQSPFGKLIYCDMQRMVDALSLVVSISSIPIHVLFRFAKMEEGLTKSVILQHQKLVKEMNDTLPPEYQKAMQ